MATVNKGSLRTEFGALKARFEALCANGKMSPESRALFEAFLMLFELLMAVFLEKNTPKSSRNSGLPSSQTGADETTRVRTGAHGKGPKSRAAPTRVVAETRTAPVTECRACGRGLEGVAAAGHERRRLVDLVFETRELTVEAEIKTCPRCRTENRGAFPKEMPGPLTYGPGIVAFAVHLLSAQMVPLKRTAQTLKALTGRAIAEATLLAWLRRLHKALADWEAAAVERLLAMPVLHADETSLRIERKNHWLHSYSADDLTLKFVHPRRGCAALDELNVIPRYGGILIHDRWASYFAYKNCKHALCGRYVALTIMLRRGSFAVPDMMNSHFLRNIICCIHSVPRKAISPLFAFHGRSGPGSAASQSAIALAFISISISAIPTDARATPRSSSLPKKRSTVLQQPRIVSLVHPRS